MPIEIRELVIKATVTPQSGGKGTTGPVAATNNSITPTEEMITTCVDKVLNILQEKKER